jgi:hypothetical protein
MAPALRERPRHQTSTAYGTRKAKSGTLMARPSGVKDPTSKPSSDPAM